MKSLKPQTRTLVSRHTAVPYLAFSYKDTLNPIKGNESDAFEELKLDPISGILQKSHRVVGALFLIDWENRIKQLLSS